MSGVRVFPGMPNAYQPACNLVLPAKHLDGLQSLSCPRPRARITLQPVSLLGRQDQIGLHMPVEAGYCADHVCRQGGLLTRKEAATQGACSIPARHR